MNKICLIIIIILTFSFSLRAQEVNNQNSQFSGTIQDSQGSAIVDASIIDINTKEETYSNEKGFFQVNAKISDTIVIKHPDYETGKIRLADNSPLSIVLKGYSGMNEKEVEEVVVTALGITKQDKKVGYSTQEIKNDNIEKITTPSLGNLFSGQVSGLQVGNRQLPFH